ncbi:MAG: hypothetical protein IH571_00060, partial [Acholeplasmataceae bacterium]|nr:hypothetical protein [Acholeplasmataceae bacterium]
LLSYNFDLSRFTATFDAYLIIGFVIFIYLVLYILSCVLTEKMTFQTVKTPIWFLVLLLFVYAYLRYGLSSAIVIALPTILVISMGQSPLAGSILVISVLVSIPFNVLSSLINGTNHFNPFNYWLFSIMGLGLLVYSILGLLQMISTKQE